MENEKNKNKTEGQKLTSRKMNIKEKNKKRIVY